MIIPPLPNWVVEHQQFDSHMRRTLRYVIKVWPLTWWDHVFVLFRLKWKLHSTYHSVINHPSFYYMYNQTNLRGWVHNRLFNILTKLDSLLVSTDSVSKADPANRANSAKNRKNTRQESRAKKDRPPSQVSRYLIFQPPLFCKPYISKHELIF